jgi:two-component system, sensor histidine kinase YesM
MFEDRFTLKGKMIFSTVLLVLVSFILVTATSFVVSSKIIEGKVYDANSVLTKSAVRKVNTTLAEIAQIINYATAESNFDLLCNLSNFTDYQATTMILEYENFLKETMNSRDDLDAVIVSFKNTSLYATNTVEFNYKSLRYGTYYDKYKVRIAKEDTASIFIDSYSEDGLPTKIIMISPVFSPTKQEVVAYFTIVLSDKFTADLRFADNKIDIIDSYGNSISLENKNKPRDYKYYEQKETLNFDGWTVINTYSIDTWNYFKKPLMTIAFIIILYIICIFLISLGAGLRLLAPIQNLTEQVLKITERGFIGKLQRNKLPRFRFRSKVFLYYITVTIIPVVFITGIFFTSTKKIIETKVGSVYEYNMKLLAKQCDFIFTKYVKSAVEIAIKREVQEYLSEVSGNNEIKKANTDNAILNIQKRYPEIMNVLLYDNRSGLIYSSFYNKNLIEKYDLSESLAFIKKNYGTPLWQYNSMNYYNKSFFRVGIQSISLLHNDSSGSRLGYVIVDIYDNELKEILNSFYQYGNVVQYLLDKDNRIVLSINNVSDGKEGFLSPDGNAGIKSMSDITNMSRKLNYYMINVPLESNQWSLAAVLPMDEYLKENRILIYNSMVMFVCLLVIVLFFSYGFSRIFISNMNYLTKVIKQVKNGDINIRFDKRSRDEIEELGNSFNQMLERLNGILVEKLDAEMKVRQAELKSRELELSLLQSQINPHFLYNTLKTVQYMVFMKDDASAIKMIKLLIKIFRICIRPGNTLIPISEELEHIDTYIAIQKMRFANNFEVEYRVDEALKCYKILKMSLQPIVENSIFHGIELIKTKGIIVIEGTVVDDKIRFKIKDNGVGITEEKLQELRKQLTGDKTTDSIGLVNVNARIKLFFGESYGVEIESVKSQGTEITLWFPVVQE